MNSIKHTLLAFGLFGCSFVANAELKLGHINSTELLKAMPEVKTADLEVMKFGKGLEEQLKYMTSEYQTKVSDFQSKQSTFSDPIKEAKIKEIQDIEKRIQEFQQQAQENISKEREKYYAPLLKKAEEAIKLVAKEKGLSYVFDLSQPGVLYSEGGEDILESVKKRLNLTSGGEITIPASSTDKSSKPLKK